MDSMHDAHQEAICKAFDAILKIFNATFVTEVVINIVALGENLVSQAWTNKMRRVLWYDHRGISDLWEGLYLTNSCLSSTAVRSRSRNRDPLDHLA